MKIKVKRFDKSIPLPAYTKGAACFDLLSREEVDIKPKEIKFVPLNVAVKIPDGYALLLFVRSSTPYKKGLMFANGVGVLDPFYCGDKDEVLAEFFNFTEKPVKISKGERLVQGMIIKTENVDWYEVEEMNDEGHGGYRHLNKEE